MKKIRIIAVVLTMLLIFSACAGTSRAKCIIENEDGSYQIRLPASGEVLALHTLEEGYLPYISDRLLQEAEQKLSEQMAQCEETTGFFITESEGYLCLAVNTVVDIPNAEGSGCGIDHEHVELRERITTPAESD